MSLSENDRVMLYGNRTEKLPTLAELSDYIKSNSSSDPVSVSVDDIAGISPDVETLLKAEDAATARAAIGAGTSNLTIGTTAGTAMAGNTPIPDAATWANLSGKPATFPPTIGTTATTAKAGNYTPAWGDVTGKPTTFTPTIGTTATTAKAGNYVPTWTEVTGKPAVIAAGADAAAARSAIGAGTSNLTLGTTASTALAGNGNAASASKLQTARAITFSGAATGTGSFDGSSAVNIELTLEPVAANNVWVDADDQTVVLQAVINELYTSITNLDIFFGEIFTELDNRIQALENAQPAT